ncbi:histidine kinase [Streptomyces sp. NBC_01224]|uniref:sensor histidine kinase n=1 Tax=Streptomyces sp. NBC_01224 TaxID=2903783 RepID=UPI002E0EB7DF|nr:histidine kinase [Streptomyces sp. NBC_01224]
MGGLSRNSVYWGGYGVVMATALMAGCLAMASTAPLLVVAALVAVAAAMFPALWSPRTAHWVPVIVLGTCAVSQVATFVFQGPVAGEAETWWLVESVGLMVLMVPAVRRPRGRTALVLTVLLTATITELPLRMVLRVDPPANFEQAVKLCLAWLLLAAAASGTGCYLRVLDARGSAALAAERRTQRLELARDLHDFAAHDVTGVVVLAQAAQVLVDQDPKRVGELLTRIEEAGRQALSSLDRTVHVFTGDDAATVRHGRHAGETADAGGDAGGDALRPRPRDLDGLKALTDRFARTGGAAVRLDLADGALADLPWRVSELGYRAVVEALTNVRRHAPGASEVCIAVSRAPYGGMDTLSITVIDDAPNVGSEEDSGEPGEPERLGGGTGLADLQRRAADMGGELAAHPHPSGGWRVSVLLPLVASGPGSGNEQDRPNG